MKEKPINLMPKPLPIAVLLALAEMRYGRREYGVIQDARRGLIVRPIG